jgi:hypothetical protein
MGAGCASSLLAKYCSAATQIYGHDRRKLSINGLNPPPLCTRCRAGRGRSAIEALDGLMCRGRIAVSAARCVEVDFDNARKIAFLGGQNTITNDIGGAQ